MIRYPITLPQLRARIAQKDPDWFTKAAAALAALPASPTSEDFAPLWNKIKDVYITLQRTKCCFCETSLEGRISQDVEHFRPKTKVKAWAVPGRLSRRGVAPSHNAADEPGYTTLAYHPFNYATSCKFCNTVLKRSYFPIAGPRNTTGNDPTLLHAEQPYLIYPIGQFDADPEQLITFVGLSPKAVAPNGFDAQRAWVTIRLFRLGSVTKRPVLYTARALLIHLLHAKLELRDRASTQIERDRYQAIVDNLTAETAPFANCMRSFKRLYDSDRPKADAFAAKCEKYLNSKQLRF